MEWGGVGGGGSDAAPWDYYREYRIPSFLTKNQRHEALLPFAEIAALFL